MQTEAVKRIWAIDPVHTKVRFDAKYLLLSTVSGWFQEIEGSVTNSKTDFSDSEITLTIYTNSIYTGIEERDNHLRSADFFHTEQFPTIRFASTAVAVEGDHIRITGQLTVKDATHEISFDARYLGSVPDSMGNTKAGFEMDMVLDRKAFDIGWNLKFDKNGILIADQVHLHADIQLLLLP
jgi:polyisoprenoid-binding protein YceI